MPQKPKRWNLWLFCHYIRQYKLVNPSSQNPDRLENIYDSHDSPRGMRHGSEFPRYIIVVRCKVVLFLERYESNKQTSRREVRRLEYFLKKRGSGCHLWNVGSSVLTFTLDALQYLLNGIYFHLHTIYVQKRFSFTKCNQNNIF